MGLIIFLSYIRGKKALFQTAGLDGSDPCADWVNVGLGVITAGSEVKGQQLGHKWKITEAFTNALQVYD